VRTTHVRFTAACLCFLSLSGCRLDSSVGPDDNLVPVADAGPDLTVTDTNRDGTEPVPLDGSGSSDPDGSITAWVWSLNDRVIASGMAPTVDLPTGTHTLRLVVTDNRRAFAEDEVVVSVLAVTDQGNAPPVADAGPDQVVVDLDANGKERVTLDPSGSHDPDGRIVDYDWSVDSERIRVDRNNRASFAVGRHTVTLTVTDNHGASDSDTVIIEVVPSGENLPPVADAGPDRVVDDLDGNGREAVEVQGSGTDPDGTIVGWEWLEGSAILATERSASLILGLGPHRITLRVTDDGGLTGTDDVTITVAAPAGNEPPTANAGPDQSIPDTDGDGSELVSLDGSGSSDSDGSIVGWRWSEGSRELATGAAAQVSLPLGTHVVTLTVTDDAGATGTDTVTITVSEVVSNQPPTADAGPDRTVADADGSGSESVSLDGSGSSDPDGAIASWEWREGSSVVGTGMTPSVLLAVGVHTITLTVTDDGGDTDTDTVVITVEASVPSVSYSRDIQPYFDDRCIGCHRNGGPAGVNLDTWQHVMDGGRSGPLVVPGDSSQGILLPKIRDGHMGAPHGTTIEQDLVSWIDAGAPND